MGFTVYLLRKEVKENGKESFIQTMEGDGFPFTEQQMRTIEQNLLRRGFEKQSASQQFGVTFHHKEKDIDALLSKNQLALSGFVSNAFEVGMTASEIADELELCKYDPQSGGWEEP